MALTTQSNFDKQLLPGLLKGIFGHVSFMGKAKEVLSRGFFDVKNTDQAFDEYSSIIGLGLYSPKEQSKGVTLSEIKENINIIISPTMKGSGCFISWETLKTHQYAKALRDSKDLAASASRTMEVGAAQFLSKLDTANWADGLPFCRTNRSTELGFFWNNLAPIPSSISEASFVADLIDQADQRDDKGNLIHNQVIDFAVSIEGEFQSSKILKSISEPSTSNNAINLITQASGLIPKVTSSPYLKGPRHYYKMSAAQTGLLHLILAEPFLKVSEDIMNLNMIFTGYFNDTYYLVDPRGVYLNKGV